MKRLFLFLLLVPGILLAGEPAPSSAANTGGSSGGSTPTFMDSLGIGKPGVDPANEIISWNGQNWNVCNNRLFESQFQEYLSAPEASDVTIVAYGKTLTKIRELLSPGKVTPQGIDEAFRLLTVASGFEIDARLSQVIASQVFMSWKSQQNTLHMQAAGQSLQQERSRLEWNLKQATKNTGLDAVGGVNKNGNASARQSIEGAEIQPITTRLVEIETLIKKNDLNQQYTGEQARLDFQVLITQFFLQRRFEHVQIAVDFYRCVFSASTGQVKLGEEAMNLFAKTTGGSPTLATIDSAASEAIQKVRTGLRSFQVMLGNRQLQSATKRLAETFMIGQNLPAMQLVPMEQKQKILTFVQTTNLLLSAIEVKDYASAEAAVQQLRATATDFDATKPNAAIQTSKVAAEMHLAKARNAAVAGDKPGLERELQAAAEIWPTNPQLKELSAKIFAQADVAAQALADFDRLNSQKNYRQIYDDKLRFIAATAMYPDKQNALKKVLDDMVEIETSIQRSIEIQKRGDNAGAWESIEIVARSFPDDTKLNQFRADLTLKAATFVNLIKNAEQFEKDGEPACALTAYLEAQRIYPYSSFAKEGIIRLSKELLPDIQ
jgi:hypothetical protein